MLDKNVRLAADHADRQEGDRRPAAARLRRADRDAGGAGICRLRSVASRSPTIRSWRKKLLAASGYSPEKPVKFTIQTTRGFKPKDYEMIQAIVGMWRKVGIDADIEVYEIAKHFELRTPHKLAPAAFYNWGNAIGDPTTSTGFAMFGPSPHSAWKADDLDAKIGPLWGEKDESQAHRRLEGRRQLHRRAGLRHPAAAIRAADRLQVRSQGDAERVRRVAADAGREGLKPRRCGPPPRRARGGHRAESVARTVRCCSPSSSTAGHGARSRLRASRSSSSCCCASCRAIPSR